MRSRPLIVISAAALAGAFAIGYFANFWERPNSPEANPDDYVLSVPGMN